MRSASSRAPADIPNTARKMISSASAWVRECSANDSPGRQAATSRSATSSIVPVSARMRSPWKAGSISLRWAMCSAPSSSSTEREPTIGSSTRAPSPGCRTSAGVANISRISSGCVRKIHLPSGGPRSTVKRSP